MSEKLMSRSDVAEMLRISMATLDRIVLRGEIPVIRLRGEGRGRVLFRPQDIEGWIQKKIVTPMGEFSSVQQGS